MSTLEAAARRADVLRELADADCPCEQFAFSRSIDCQARISEFAPGVAKEDRDQVADMLRGSMPGVTPPAGRCTESRFTHLNGLRPLLLPDTQAWDRQH